MSSIATHTTYTCYNNIIILNTNGNKKKKYEKISTTESIIKDDTAKCWAGGRPKIVEIVNVRVMCI